MKKAFLCSEQFSASFYESAVSGEATWESIRSIPTPVLKGSNLRRDYQTSIPLRKFVVPDKQLNSSCLITRRSDARLNAHISRGNSLEYSLLSICGLATESALNQLEKRKLEPK